MGMLPSSGDTAVEDIMGKRSQNQFLSAVFVACTPFHAEKDGSEPFTALVAARLRHVSSTTWGTREYMNINLLTEMAQEAIRSVA